jgi:hypothetical protein
MARRKLGAHHAITINMPGVPAQPGEHPMLHHWREAYELSGYRYCALQALLECDARNLPVPPWLRRFLAEGARRHLDNGADLNKTIGTAGAKEGSRRQGKKKYDRWMELRFLTTLVDQTRKLDDPKTGRKLGVTGACEVLARRFKQNASSLETFYRTFKTTKS